MRNVAMQEIMRLAETDERICFVGSDLGFRVMHDFHTRFPERIFREGISEQHAIGLSAGLALEGKRVYVNTIASFLVKRALEQISLDLCSTRLPVCLLGNGGGVLYAPLGPTHLIPEDFALLRTMPNMTIFAPCDAVEMEKIIALTHQLQGPSYIRIGLNNCPVVSLSDADYQIGKAICLTSWQSVDTDILLLTTGMTAQIGIAAVKELSAQGIQANVLHYHTIKPFDTESLCLYGQNAKYILTIEEHSIAGGLGTAALECLSETNILRTAQFQRIGLPDKFLSEHGSRDMLVAKYGISVENVVRLVKTVALAT